MSEHNGTLPSAKAYHPRDLVIDKCCLYLGADYELADKKTEALGQGHLSALDKAETAAKARCARDFGISTELALEMGEENLEADGSEGVGVCRPYCGTCTSTRAGQRAKGSCSTRCREGPGVDRLLRRQRAANA
jgi:hypothetical protein